MKWPRNVLAVMFFSTATSYASSGGQAVLYMYFDEHMHWGDNDATAAASFYICVMQIFGVAGALISDHWLGKLRTQMLTCTIWVVGTLLMLASVAHADRADLDGSAGILVAMLGVCLVAVGSGGMSPSLSAFVGDQATSLSDVPAFYSWFYFFQNVGALFGEAGCPLLRQHVSFTVTFLTIAGSMVVGFGCFVWGRSTFISRDDGVPEPTRLTCKCSPVVAHYTPEDRAGLWRVLKIFLPLPAFWALFFQQNSAVSAAVLMYTTAAKCSPWTPLHDPQWITQTQQMDTKLIWHTVDILGSVEDLMVCVFVPLFATIVYPFLERRPKLNPTPLRKMAFGMACTCLAFLSAALVQVLIDHSAPGTVSVAWQLPQFLLIAVAETTVAVTGLEFAFTQCGPNTRSLVQALWNLMQLGQFLTGVIAGLKIGTLEQDFWFYCGLMGVFTIVFILIALSYQYNDRTGLEEHGAKATQHTLLPDEPEAETAPTGAGDGSAGDGRTTPKTAAKGSERDALLASPAGSTNHGHGTIGAV